MQEILVELKMEQSYLEENQEQGKISDLSFLMLINWQVGVK